MEDALLYLKICICVYVYMYTCISATVGDIPNYTKK